MACVDARAWGPRLRYFAPAKLLAEFDRAVLAGLPRFVLYGSGDFHHLAGWLLRRVEGPVTLVSFDNHPDWDVRPPRWGCGGWVNRALELANVQKASVWGCGNFELDWPGRVFANRRELRSGRLEVHPWAERFGAATARRFDAMTRGNWRERFEAFACGLKTPVYVTVDMDCLDSAHAVTNWENGLFTADDIAWAVGRLRECSKVVGGDVCGAYSRPRFEQWTQKLAGWWDHPKLAAVVLAVAREINLKSLERIWPALVGEP
jgi:arginase family enzyme